MSVDDIINRRHSVRSYSPRAVEPEKLDAILEAGRRCPTAGNRQPHRFLVLRGRSSVARLDRAGKFHGAPAAIVILGDHTAGWVRPQDGKEMIDIDTSIATTHLMFKATELGLGTCWLTWFDPAIVRSEFKLPPHIEPVHVLVLGYSDEPTPDPDRFDRDRRPLSELVRFDTWE